MPHILDQLSLGKIVQIRERLMQSARDGLKVYRFESGDPEFLARAACARCPRGSG